MISDGRAVKRSMLGVVYVVVLLGKILCGSFPQLYCSVVIEMCYACSI